MSNKKTKEQLSLEYGYRQVLKYVNDIVTATELTQQTNSQAFIDFLDELNEISVKY